MKKYAVAVISFFENENTVQIVEASNEIEAVKKAVIVFNNKFDKRNEETLKENEDWLNEISSTLENLLDELINGELGVSKPILIE